MKKKILFYCGSANQTSQLYQISQFLQDDYDCWFSAAFADNWERFPLRWGLFEVTIAGNARSKAALDWLTERGCQIDHGAKKNEYDLAYLCTDIYQPDRFNQFKRIVVQEGFVMPEDWRAPIIKRMNWNYAYGDTSLTALTDKYDYFCCAGEGYRQFFINRGANPDKLVTTGVPNFDDIDSHMENDLPERDFALIITSSIREAVGFENRMKYLRYALKMADGREMIFKLHPEENHKRATREIRRLTKEGTILTKGHTEHMIANSACVISSPSSVIMTALAMGKEVHSPNYSDEEIQLFKPLQNGGTSAKTIADFGRKFIEE